MNGPNFEHNGSECSAKMVTETAEFIWFWMEFFLSVLFLVVVCGSSISYCARNSKRYAKIKEWEKKFPRDRVIKVNVIGATGSGKSTLSKKIAQKLGIEHIELDHLYWKPNWKESETSEFRERVSSHLHLKESKSTQISGWIVDGNYSKVRDQVLEQVNIIVWLDFSIWVNFFRLTRRTSGRVFRKMKVCNGNTENLYRTLFTKDSIFYWLWKTHDKHRINNKELFHQLENSQRIHCFHLTSTDDVDLWLQCLWNHLNSLPK